MICFCSVFKPSSVFPKRIDRDPIKIKDYGKNQDQAEVALLFRYLKYGIDWKWCIFRIWTSANNESVDQPSDFKGHASNVQRNLKDFWIVKYPTILKCVWSFAAIIWTKWRGIAGSNRCWKQPTRSNRAQIAHSVWVCSKIPSGKPTYLWKITTCNEKTHDFDSHFQWLCKTTRG